MSAKKLRDTFRIGKDEANHVFTEIGDVRLTLVWRRFDAAGNWSRVIYFLRVQVFDGPNKGSKLLPGVEIPIHDCGTLTDLFGQAVRMFGKQQEETIEGLWDECEECGDAEFHYTYGCGYPPDEADDSHVLPAYAAADYETASGWVWVSVKDMDRKPGTRWLGAAILKGRDSMGAYYHATAIFGCGQEAGSVTPVHRLGVIPPPELQYQISDSAEAKRLAADLSWQMPTPSAPIKKLSPEVAVTA